MNFAEATKQYADTREQLLSIRAALRKAQKDLADATETLELYANSARPQLEALVTWLRAPRDRGQPCSNEDLRLLVDELIAVENLRKDLHEASTSTRENSTLERRLSKQLLDLAAKLPQLLHADMSGVLGAPPPATSAEGSGPEAVTP